MAKAKSFVFNTQPEKALIKRLRIRCYSWAHLEFNQSSHQITMPLNFKESAFYPELPQGISILRMLLYPIVTPTYH